MAEIPIIVGCLFIIISVYFLFDTYNFRKRSRQTLGRVVDYESSILHSKETGTSTVYTPVVDFEYNDSTYRFKSDISRSIKPYDVGQSVPVIFLESDPDNARIRTDFRYVIGGGFLLLGIICLVVGIANL